MLIDFFLLLFLRAFYINKYNFTWSTLVYSFIYITRTISCHIVKLLKITHFCDKKIARDQDFSHRQWTSRAYSTRFTRVILYKHFNIKFNFIIFFLFQVSSSSKRAQSLLHKKFLEEVCAWFFVAIIASLTLLSCKKSGSTSKTPCSLSMLSPLITSSRLTT